MERFFDLFHDRQLALDLFTIVEDVRIDARVRASTAASARSWATSRRRSWSAGRTPRDAAAAQAFVENLVRASLDGARDNRLAGAAEPRRSARRCDARPSVPMRRPRGRPSRTRRRRRCCLYELADEVPNLPPEQLEASTGTR